MGGFLVGIVFVIVFVLGDKDFGLENGAAIELNNRLFNIMSFSEIFLLLINNCFRIFNLYGAAKQLLNVFTSI